MYVGEPALWLWLVGDIPTIPEGGVGVLGRICFDHHLCRVRLAILAVNGDRAGLAPASPGSDLSMVRPAARDITALREA